jgi:hypothetical protein
MLAVGPTNYPLCLLDTLAVSEIVKSPEAAFPRYYDWALKSDPGFLPTFTLYTLMELRRRPDLFRRFIDRFQHVPSVFLKGYANLIEDEVAAYPHAERVDPCAIAFTPLGGEGNHLSVLPRLMGLPDNLARERHWNDESPGIVAGMVSLVPNYPPDGAAYTTAEIAQFVRLASLAQLAELHPDFLGSVSGGIEAIDLDAFPSLKAMTYTVFHKFYNDRNRKPSESDAFDVLISAALPYVEAFITEAHQADALGKIKRRDGFLANLQVFTLRDFR